MKVKMWIEDGIIRCASQLCQDCTAKNSCKEGRLIIADSYWSNICDIQEKQEKKGFNKYKMLLEANTTMDMLTRIQYLEEELVDSLMYLEHIKSLLGTIQDSLKVLKSFETNKYKIDLIISALKSIDEKEYKNE